MTKEQVREFLDRDDIRDLVADEKLEEVYNKCNGVSRKDLTEYLLSLGVQPDGYMKIIPSSFLQSSQISSYSISPTVSIIDAYAFRDCTKLTSITIPNSVTSIGHYAFCNCASLTSITIPDSVTSIGYFAFDLCSSLVNITIPDSVTHLGSGAFSYCESLTSVTIGNGVTSIDDGVFYSCLSLTSVTIPDSVTTIGKNALCNCGDIEIYYSGTKQKFRSIVKGAFKDTYYVVHCVDGDIVKRRK